MIAALLRHAGRRRQTRPVFDADDTTQSNTAVAICRSLAMADSPVTGAAELSAHRLQLVSQMSSLLASLKSTPDHAGARQSRIRRQRRRETAEQQFDAFVIPFAPA